MQLSEAPLQIVEPFGADAGADYINTIPVPSQIPITPGAASYHDGFPPLTMTAENMGGVPISGPDLNGILNEATAVDNWMSAGAGFVFNSAFATAIGGYPRGARLLMANANGYWLNTVDNNSTNPDTGSAPTGWIPFGVRATASVYASAQQTVAAGNHKVLWDTVEFDSYGQWDSANKRFKALWAGIYRFSGSVLLYPPAPQNLACVIYKNGTFVKQCSAFPEITDQNLSYSFDAMIQCAAGDYLESFLYVSASDVLAGISGSNQPYVYGQLEYLGS